MGLAFRLSRVLLFVAFFFLGFHWGTKAQNPSVDQFVRIQGGKFLLGASDIPVELSSFYISPTEVSYGQMAEYAKSVGLRPEKYQDPSWGEILPERPAVYVSWFEAIRYANWLSKKNGFTPVYQVYAKNNKLLSAKDSAYWQNKLWDFIQVNLQANGYRLPTEVEWEYASSTYLKITKKQAESEAESFRNNETPIYDTVLAKQRYAGCDFLKELPEYAWFATNAGKRAHSTASLKPNGRGLYDMSGNVWEWCMDVYNADIFETYRNQKNPLNINKNKPYYSYRCLRGGSWFVEGEYCRTSTRLYDYAWFEYNYIGFRLCRNE